MKKLAKLFVRMAAVVVMIGMIQAVVEAAVLAVLYRDLLFAPYRFFTIQIYDAFTKLYFLLATVVPLPQVLGTFLGQGIAAKLTLLPELAAVNVFVALLVTLVLLPLAPLVGIRADAPARRVVVRTAVLVSVLQLAVHVADWLISVKMPLDPTIANVTSNLVRDAIFDGVLIAMGVTVVGAVLEVAMGSKAGAGAAAIACALALLPAAAPAPTVPSASAPAAGYNVVLVSIDSLRADHTSAYGYERDTTPTMKALAAEGVMFTNCSSTTSWTLPAHMSMLTGRSLLGHGVISDDRRLSADVPTLAQAFKLAGYDTGAVVSAPYLESRYGFDKGFDDYDDHTISFATNDESYKTVTAPLVNRTADAWLAAHGSRPFFLFLHYWDVHYDYAPGPGYDRMFDPDYKGHITGDNFYFNDAVHEGMDPRDLAHIVALYDGEIREVDDHIGKLRATLARLGFADHTILIVTADHGDEFFEHGNKGHHRTLYEEVLAVPLVIYAPGVPIARRRIDVESSIIDIAPTVLGLTGIEAPPGFEGVDFSSTITGTGPEPVRPVFGELYRKGSLNVQVAAIAAREKAIHQFNVRRMETYDLTADPAESAPLSNTAGPGAELASTMRGWLQGEWKIFDKRVREHGVDNLQMDAKTEQALKALGYLEP
jgi:arylsulfatase A-like enzyme